MFTAIVMSARRSGAIRLRAGTLAAILVLAAIACTPRSAIEQAVPPDCVSGLVAIVTNNLGESIDVMTTVPGRPTAITLGSVSAGGRQQFDLPRGARSVYPQISGRGMSDAQRERVVARYECR
jgi:hypothetical protein